MVMREMLGLGRAKILRLYRQHVDGESEATLNCLPEDRIELTFISCIPDGDEFIVRTRSIARAYGQTIDLAYSFEDIKGNSIDAKTVVLSTTFLDERVMNGVASWEVIASTRISRSSIPLRLRVSDVSGVLCDASRCLNKRRLRCLLADWNKRSSSAWDDSRYDTWFNQHKADMQDLQRQKEEKLEYEPLISIVTPLFNTPLNFFHDMVSSVVNQSYANWELVLVNASPGNAELKMAIDGISDNRIRVIILDDNKGIVTNTNAGIKAAKGDFIAFLDHDDFLEPDTLYRYVKAINEHNTVGLLYCDEDSYSPGGRFIHPHFKSDFNRDLLYSHNYITHFLMVRASILHEVGLSPEYVEGAQDYDLTLRVIEASQDVIHIPRVLYHWRIHSASTSENADSKPYAQEAGRRALQDHFARRSIAVDVSDGIAPFTYVESFHLQGKPLVSIIIPNKDHIDVLQPCVESLLNDSTYRNIEIIVVENNSVEESTFEYYGVLAENSNVRIVNFEGAFNYSKIINFGVSAAKGEYLLLLNNDTQLITPDFIEQMLGYFTRDEVGVVGIKLLHFDDTVQHAGVYIGPNDAPWHLFMDAPDSYNGYFNRAILAQDCLAVTGACQMVKKSFYEELGGYGEEFAVAYNDVDFCLKAQAANRLCVYLAHVKMYHREFTSRGFDVSLEDRVRFFGEKTQLQSKWPLYFVGGDPYYNSNLDKDSLFFGLGE